MRAVRALPRPAHSFAESLTRIGRRGAREAERQALESVLERVHWNRAEASRILKVSYKTLLNKIAECRLSPPSRQCRSDEGLPREPRHCPVQVE